MQDTHTIVENVIGITGLHKAASYSSSILILLFIVILFVDTIRSIIASLGWIRRDSKVGRFVYGKNEKNILISALREMGYSSEKTEKNAKSMRALAADLSKKTNVKEKDADIWLILLLAKYTEMFSNEISYGGNISLQSHYFIDSMGISHNKEDLYILNSLMHHLLTRKLHGGKKPDVIISLKGGNPIFARAVAVDLNSKLINAKPKDDNSRINDSVESESDSIDAFKINFEGAGHVLESKEKLSCIILDCNTSDGEKMRDAIAEINRVASKNKKKFKLKYPKQAFVLFCTPSSEIDIEEIFSTLGVSLVRYFDVDESTRKKLYKLKERCKDERRMPSFFYKSDKEEAGQILQYIKQNNKYYY